MTHISVILRAGRSVSFEFFPPRTDEAQAVLERTLVELEPLAPSVESLSYIVIEKCFLPILMYERRI